MGGFRVRERLRERVTWGIHNLLAPNVPEKDFDIILCRNVLIYFSEANKRLVLERLFGATRDAGLVALGATEQARCAPLYPGWYTSGETARSA